MSDLEDLGYLDSPHTSAGRIPSNKAYRLYVDSLLEGQTVFPDADSVREFFYDRMRQMQDVVESRREEDMGDEVDLPDFLQEVALLTDLDSDDGDSNDKVVLMTVHAAKGLEFPTVFVVGLEENIFPSPMCTNSMRELEEERRLCAEPIPLRTYGVRHTIALYT